MVAHQVRVTLAKCFFSLCKSREGCPAGQLVEGFAHEGFYLHGRLSGCPLRKFHLAAVSLSQAVVQVLERERSGFVPSVAHEVVISDEWNAYVPV